MHKIYMKYTNHTGKMNKSDGISKHMSSISEKLLIAVSYNKNLPYTMLPQGYAQVRGLW